MISNSLLVMNLNNFMIARAKVPRGKIFCFEILNKSALLCGEENGVIEVISFDNNPLFNFTNTYKHAGAAHNDIIHIVWFMENIVAYAIKGLGIVLLEFDERIANRQKQFRVIESEKMSALKEVNNCSITKFRNELLVFD